MIKKKCKQCSKDFKIYPCIDKIGGGITCSVQCKNLYQAGEHNPFFGKKHSESTKQRLSLLRLGKKFGPHSEETKRKIGLGNKGKVMSAEQRERLGQSRLGKKLSKEVREHISLGHQGSKHWNWQGGINPLNEKQRSIFKNHVQKEVLKRDDYTCQLCGTRGGELNVDHIQKWSEYVEGRFSMDNCRTLCVECHYEITFGFPMPKES